MRSSHTFLVEASKPTNSSTGIFDTFPFPPSENSPASGQIGAGSVGVARGHGVEELLYGGLRTGVWRSAASNRKEESNKLNKIRPMPDSLSSSV